MIQVSMYYCNTLQYEHKAHNFQYTAYTPGTSQGIQELEINLVSLVELHMCKLRWLVASLCSICRKPQALFFVFQCIAIVQ